MIGGSCQLDSTEASRTSTGPRDLGAKGFYAFLVRVRSEIQAGEDALALSGSVAHAGA